MQIIISIPKPNDDEHVAIGKWEAVVSNLRSKVGTRKEVDVLGQSAFLFREENGLAFLVDVLSLAQEQKVPYRILFVEKMTEWNS